MELELINSNDQSKTKIQVSDVTFAQPYNETLIHQVVTAYLAQKRAGTKAQKTRAEVRGGGRKPWRQKGTGRARAGTIRSPLWRGGGVIFAAKPRSYAQKINKKMYRLAMRSMMAELARKNRLTVVTDFILSSPKTKDLVMQLNGLNLKNVLIVTDQVDENLYLAARNVNQVDVCDVAVLDPLSLISFENILLTQTALKQIEERLG